ncbi:MAG: hypothetical protein ACKVUT_01600 [Gaiella sp.]
MTGLERELVALSAVVDWPEARDVSVAVEHRIGLVPERRPSRRPAVALGIALVATVVAGLLAAPGTRSAILRFLHLGAIEVEQVETLPDIPRTQSFRAFGELIDGTGATRLLGLAVLPFPRSLGRPDEVRGRRAPTRQVTYIWKRPGGPVVVTRFAVRVDEYAGKIVSREARVVFVDVGGATALWIEGARHLALPAGRASVEAGRLAGDTLIVADASGTIRIEGLDREAAIRLAGELAG